jgi:hypothetical protein
MNRPVGRPLQKPVITSQFQMLAGSLSKLVPSDFAKPSTVGQLECVWAEFVIIRGWFLSFDLYSL